MVLLMTLHIFVLNTISIFIHLIQFQQIFILITFQMIFSDLISNDLNKSSFKPIFVLIQF